jgi:glycosidase
MDAEDFAFECERLLASHGDATPGMLNLLGSHDTPRLLTLCGGDERRALLALTALFTAPGAPMLYYGDEVGMEGENDPDCRRCMEWDETRWRRPLADRVRRLIELRHDLVPLRQGSWETLLRFNGLLAFRRACGDQETIVVLNPRDAQHDLTVPLAPSRAERWRDVLQDGVYSAVDGGVRLPTVPATSAMILVPAGAT